jgi:hypothetical protein
MYRHIVQSCTKARSKTKSVCKSIAAATVNKLRKKQNRTLSGFGAVLVNVEDMARKHPKTFQIASKKERSGLVAGKYAKLIWQSDDGGERPWVRVTGRKGDRYTGIVDNDTFVKGTPKLGAKVTFGPENVADFQGLGCGCEGKRR